LLAGNLYVNIHTAGRPGGEIRGQILPRTVDLVNFTANAAQVVPPGTSSATATCTADLDGPATTIAINCTHTLPSPAAAHVHQAPRGANGPIVYTFPSATSPFGGAMPVTPRLIADYAAALLYLDIHGSGGTEATGNQIRGQIETPLAPVTTGTINIVKSTSPAGGSGFNFTDNVPGSAGAFTLSDGGTRTFANVAAGTYTIAEAVTAGYTVSDIRCTDGDSTANAFSRAATVRLQAGENVTCTFHNLQTLAGATPYVFHLSGAQEVPPVPTTARGGCMGQLDAANARFSLVCTHNVIGATIAHIHKGAPGAAGDIVFDLGTPESPIEATWTNMTPQNIADLVAGNLYVNIHAGGRPSGEIRGQIVPRSVDHFNFPMTPQQEVPAIASPSIGACSTDLSDNATSLFLQCQHNVPNTSDAHLHGAPAGFDGPVIFHLPLTPQFSTNLPLTPRFVADFAAGFLYTNVHSVDYPEGEIRGQLIAGAVSPVPPTVPIPTLSEWMLLLLAAAVTVIAALRLR
ncbi:MAG TPA: IPTL-CTERM sorting domain-containing protein, partial [Thermoanaerobaculia bacterium]